MAEGIGLADCQDNHVQNMSDWGLSLCWRLNLPVTDKIVFIHLATTAAIYGPKFPVDTEEVAHDCLVPERAIDVVLKSLESLGVIVRHAPSWFSLVLDRVEELAAPLPSPVITKPRVSTLRLTGNAWSDMRATVFQRDNFACCYCGETNGPLHLDHIVPVSRGGSNDISNLATACFRCNCSKGAKLLSEWGGQA